MNLSYLLAIAGRTSEGQEVVEHGLALARRRGDRTWEQSLTTNLLSSYFTTGRWDDFERAFAEIPEEGRVATNPVQATPTLISAHMALHRGEPDKVVEIARGYAEWAPDAANIQTRGIGLWARVLVAQAEGRHDDALAAYHEALAHPGFSSDPIAVEGFLEHGGESGIALSSEAALTELIAVAAAAPIDPTPPAVAAKLELQRARLGVLRGDDDPPFASAVAGLREIGEPFWIATALLEQAEWLAAHGRTDETGPLVAEAREIFERLRVTPRLERIDRLEAGAPARVA